MRVLAPTLALCVAISGCTLANLTPQARFQESAYTLNDAARWGQVDLAMQHVSMKYQPLFAERHREWGETISIAEVEMLRMQIAEDRKSATTEINLSWYDTAGVTVRSSTVTQKWEAEKGKFRLVDEAIRRGDTRIFAAPVAQQSEGG